MPAAPLPPVLEAKLSDLAAGVRRLRVARGLGWLTLTMFGGAGLAIGLDAAFDLPGWVRGLMLVGWLAAAGLVAWRLVVRPWREPVPAAGLAALVERYFPGLSERLTTLVELHERIEPGNGSRGLVGVLARETDQRTRRLDFSRAAPAGPAVSVAALAAVAAVAVLAPLALVGGSGERVRRFALPWYHPPVDVPYRIIVSSGDPVVRRGESVTLSAYLEPTRPGAALPASAALVVRGPGSQAERKLPMAGGEGAAFHLTRPGVADDFEYCVEAGPARSEWHAVFAADPVALADGTSLTVHPPAYAAGVVKEVTRDGFAEFDALQYSRAGLALRFNRPPAEAYLEWRPADPAQGEPARVSVRLSDDRTAGEAEVPVAGDGTLVLVLVGDRGVRTELPAAVRAAPDAPPRFEKAVGLTGSAREVRPDDHVPIELAARDDIRLDALRVEYCLNGNEADVRSEPVPLAGVGSGRVEGAFAFSLTGKVKEGDTLLIRVRASDNRSVPDKKLGPQHAIFPPDGWATLRVTASARPLAEQEVLAQRDKVRDKLAEAVKLVRDAATDAAAVREALPADGPLAQDQAVRLQRARGSTTDAGKLLGDLAGEVGLAPDLRPLAEAVRGVADGPLRTAEAALKAAEMEPTNAGREKALAAAAEKLADALARLADLDARNEKAAQARLDRLGLRQIADDQTALAEQAGKPGAPPDELAKKQRDLAARLNEAVARSGLLRGALDAAAEERLRDLLARLKKLADDQAALDRAVRETEELARKRQTEALARGQQGIAAEAARLADRTAAAARLAGTAPPDRQPFEQAVERLARGDTDRALTEQEKAARELDRLAEALARAAAARGDRKEAARQVARWQDDLRRRYEDAVKQSPGGELPDAVQKRFADEQHTIRDAVERLRQKAADTELARAGEAARDAVTAAAEALDRKPADVPATLRRAADALAGLAERTPAAEERARQAKAQLDQLRKEQEAIGRDADEAVRGARKDALGQKLDATAARQAALAGKVRRLDVPGQEARRDAAAAAADRAADDLRSGLLPDVPLSQQEARRHLDRLRQALDGVPPPDEQAEEVARLQRKVADAAARLPAQPTADQWTPLQQLQREVVRRAGSLSAPEAAGQLAEARDAARAADEEARKADRPDKLRKKAREAADALARLADRLSGAESDRERVERLVRERAAEVARAKQFERQPANPEAAAEAQRQLQRQLDELDQTRAGKAQAAKQKAAEALQRLRQAADPARNLARQQDAADALRRLADEMARNGDRPATHRPVGPPAPTEADELRRLTGGGNLPTERDAEAARDLARRQRQLRDATSETAAELARGVRPADKDALGPLADEQDGIARAARGLEGRLDPEKSPAGKRQGGKAAADAVRAAEQLRAGSVAAALGAATEAEADLHGLAGSDLPADAAKEARDLAARQADLVEKLKTLAGDPAVESARQHRRQGELAAEAGRLTDALRDAADAAPDSPLGRAADGTTQAQEKMRQADRDAAAGRAGPAAEARRQAADVLSRTAADAEAAIGLLPEPAAADRDARDAGAAVRQAGDRMRQAERALGRPNGAGPAAGAMKQAADALARAAAALGRSLGGQRPGGNDGSNAGPRSETPPAEIDQYLGRPWGELPGDVRSKVIQELAARYGEDYARTIKLYFESLAARK